MLKKKGRKPKSYYENLKLLELSNNNLSDISNISNNVINNIINKNAVDLSGNNLPKKRGRKPKGGKIVEDKKNIIYNTTVHNIIIHLKCNIKDICSEDELTYNPYINIIDNYNLDNNNLLNYNYLNNSTNLDNNNLDNNNLDNINLDNLDNLNNLDNLDNNNLNNLSKLNNTDLNNTSLNNTDLNNSNLDNTNLDNINLDSKKFIIIDSNFENNKNNKTTINDENKNEIIDKILFKKLKQINFNNLNYNINTNAACFWCTCNFSNENIYIPKYELNGNYYC